MSKDVSKPFWDHMEDLAHCLRVIVVSVVVSTVAIAMFPANPRALLALRFTEYTPLISHIIRRIEGDLLPNGVSLIANTWMSIVYVYFMVAIALGVIVSSPIIAYEIYRFINPALFPHESRFLYSFVAAFTLLFTAGAAYSYLVLLPVTYKILMRFVYGVGAMPFFSVYDFFRFVILGTLMSGLVFTFPIFVVMLIRFELIDVRTLAENRRKVFVGLLIGTAIVTPDPTPFSMLLLSIPFYALYEASIQVGRWMTRKGEREEGA